MSFGHWEIFRQLITALRDIEKHQPVITFAQDTIDSNEGHNTSHPSQMVRQKSQMEKQVCANFFIYFFCSIMIT